MTHIPALHAIPTSCNETGRAKEEEVCQTLHAGVKDVVGRLGRSVDALPETQFPTAVCHTKLEREGGEERERRREGEEKTEREGVVGETREKDVGVGDNRRGKNKTPFPTLTLFPSGVKRILVTPPPIPGTRCVATDLGVPNSHMVTEPSREPVKSVSLHTASHTRKNGG